MVSGLPDQQHSNSRSVDFRKPIRSRNEIYDNAYIGTTTIMRGNVPIKFTGRLYGRARTACSPRGASSEMGQTEKNSVRANVFRVTRESGPYSIQSACLKGATALNRCAIARGGGRGAH